jgi:opacity protein-like surface antigen
MKKITGVLVTAILFLCPFAFAQDGVFDIGVNLAGKLPKTTEGNGIVQTPTNSVGFLGTLGIKLTSKVSLQANWEAGYDSQKYQTGTLFYQVGTDIREFTGDFAYHPFRHGKWEPFLLGGAGILSFGPGYGNVDGVQTAIGAVRQIKPTFLYGAGTDYRLTPNVAFRLQYRGLFYQPPDFKVPYLFTGGQGHLAEPSIGIAINF